jgi:hypothetical protein
VIEDAAVPQRECEDAAKVWASVKLQQLDAMVAAGTDEQLAMAFGHREVSVTAAEFGGSVNDHDGVSKAKNGYVVGSVTTRAGGFR